MHTRLTSFLPLVSRAPRSSPRLPQVWDLSQVVRHTTELLHTQCLLPGRPPLVLAAHSVGAHIAAHALANVERENKVARTVVGAAAPPQPPVLRVRPGLWCSWGVCGAWAARATCVGCEGMTMGKGGGRVRVERAGVE
eukprot:359927-Chlamydomonas_euryale.AAC.1